MRISLSFCFSALLPSLAFGSRRKLTKQAKKSDGCHHDNPPNFPDRIQSPYDPWLPEESGTPESPTSIPSVSQPFYNNVIDVRATASAKNMELIVNTNGAFQFALQELLNGAYFRDNPGVKSSYLVTTTLLTKQMDTGLVKVGNILFENAEPHVVIASDHVSIPHVRSPDNPFDIYLNYGNVILKRHKDPSINSFADLTEIDAGRFASATAAEDPAAADNFRSSVRDICNQNPDGADVFDPDFVFYVSCERLETTLFDTKGVAAIGGPMHHSIPHSIATGKADAGLIQLELAVGIMRNNPGVFEAVYLAKDKTGSTADPEILSLGQDPVDGNRVETVRAAVTTTEVNYEQEIARDNFIETLKSSVIMDPILEGSGLRRPPAMLA